MMGSETQFETLTLSDPLSTVHSSTDVSDPLLNPPLPDSPTSPSTTTTTPDPPSYADVIFSPFTTTTNGNNNNNSNHTWDHLQISVSDPQKEQEPSNSLVPTTTAYITYLITSRTRTQAEYSVRRRFRDVVMLSEKLAENYRGLFIPPRPDKSVVEGQVMQKQEFVEQRKVAMEKYLSRLAKHPVIGKGEELKVFLRAPGRFVIEGRESDVVASRMVDDGEGGGDEVAGKGAGGRDLLRMFWELKQSVVNDWGGARPLVVEEDKEFLERKEKVKDLEQQLTTASQQAEALVKAQHDIGETIGELGLSFFKLGKFESEEAIYNSQKTRASDYRRLGTAAVKASRCCRESNAQTVNHLDTLHEYLGLMLAVHNAFSDRSSALLTVQTLMSDLSSLHARAEKLEAASSKIFGGDKSRINKIEELKETIRSTEDAKSRANREYERIKENNRNELDRLERERHDDFLGMLKGFVINQVGYAEKTASVWTQVVEETRKYSRARD